MQFSDIKAIIFDMDGTLAKTTKLDVDTFKLLFNDNKKDFASYFGPSLITIFDELREENYTKTRNSILVKRWHQIFKKISKEKKLIDDSTIKTLKYLKDKYMLGIVTGSDKYVTNVVLKENKCLFKEIVTASDYKYSKPNPHSMNKILKKYNLKRNEVIYVGDNYKDILYSKNAGIFSCAKIDDLYPKETLKKYNPDIIIRHIFELKKYF